MTEDQIPEFVDAILSTGSPMVAVGENHYVLGEVDVPEADLERVSREVHKISLRFGERDHLRKEIIAYLYSIGRFFEHEHQTRH